MDDNLQSEQVLLARVRELDPAALQLVYDRHNEELYRYAWRQLGDVMTAEDCVAETFTGFLDALRQGKGPNQYVRAYLFRIAHNWIVDFYRRQPQPESSLDEVKVASSDSDDTSGVVARNLEQREVIDALIHLTDEQRQVITLRFLEEWSHEEISKAMDKPVGAIKALQHRAVNALRRNLTDRDEVGDEN
jgi:RNA polymerase sigma-70 factor (ECF subfamily)